MLPNARILHENRHSTLAFELQVAALGRSEANFNEICAVARFAAEPHEGCHAFPGFEGGNQNMQKQKHRCLLVTNAQICCVFDDKILHLKHNLPETAMKKKGNKRARGP